MTLPFVSAELADMASDAHTLCCDFHHLTHCVRLLPTFSGQVSPLLQGQCIVAITSSRNIKFYRPRLVAELFPKITSHVSPLLQGQCVVAITSGSNINFERLRLVAELAELGSNAEHMLASTISGVPGSLQAFVETATANKENITELRHR